MPRILSAIVEAVWCRRASIWLLVFITGAFCTPVHADTLDVTLAAGSGPVEFSYVGPSTTFTAQVSPFGGSGGVYPLETWSWTAGIGGLNAFIIPFHGLSTSSWNFPGPGPCGDPTACNSSVSGQFDFSPVSVVLTLSLGGGCSVQTPPFGLCDDFHLPSQVVVTIDTNAGELFLGPAPIPLPATLPLFATGLGALGLLGWRRKRKTAATPA